MNKEKICWLLIDVISLVLLFVSVLAVFFGGRLWTVLGVICALVGFVIHKWLQSKRPVYLTYR